MCIRDRFDVDPLYLKSIPGFPLERSTLIKASTPATVNTSLGLMVPIPNLPAEVIRSLSMLAVSTVTVSLVGNLMAVSVSPVWMILSAIDTSLCAVIIPTESILVTSS